jgi:hypothetical protein
LSLPQSRLRGTSRNEGASPTTLPVPARLRRSSVGAAGSRCGFCQITEACPPDAFAGHRVKVEARPRAPELGRLVVVGFRGSALARVGAELGAHSNKYYQFVNNALTRAAEKGTTSAVQALGQIREGLSTGKLGL